MLQLRNSGVRLPALLLLYSMLRVQCDSAVGALVIRRLVAVIACR
jgi:hypothetical protein